MIRTLLQLLRAGNVTQPDLFPDLPSYSRGLPMVTNEPCAATGGCKACRDACPTSAISVEAASGAVALDRGRCIGCGLCTDICPTGTLVPDRRTTVAVLRRSDLVQTNALALLGHAYPATQAVVLEERGGEGDNLPVRGPVSISGATLGDDQATDSYVEGAIRAGRSTPRAVDKSFRRSLHVRVVSTGDSASDLELQASNNAIFDASRFGVHVVASPRFADALIVTGPVPRTMREPLRRCYLAMAEPRLVVAVGASAISGGVYGRGYAQANGVDGSGIYDDVGASQRPLDAALPVDAYVPGHPPHPWYILHGLLTLMGHPSLSH